MTKPPRTDKVHREAVELLRSTGRPWELRHGKRHVHVILDGRMIGVLCSYSGKGRDTTMIRAAIRRHIREHPTP